MKQDSWELKILLKLLTIKNLQPSHGQHIRVPVHSLAYSCVLMFLPPIAIPWSQIAKLSTWRVQSWNGARSVVKLVGYTNTFCLWQQTNGEWTSQPALVLRNSPFRNTCSNSNYTSPAYMIGCTYELLYHNHRKIKPVSAPTHLKAMSFNL
jgi:hypothetical protein